MPGSECEVIGSFDPAIKNELRAESQALFDELASGKKPFTITDKETLKVQLNEHLQGKTRALIVVKPKGDSVWTKNNKGKVIEGIEVALNFRTHGGDKYCISWRCKRFGLGR